MIWVIGCFATLAIVPFLAEALRPRMTAAERQQAPGAFANLSGGLTHYRWCGPPDGPVAVCIHGLSTPSFVWNPIAEGLAGKGYRVLTYDLLGRGYSDRPAGAQTGAFFVSQLEDLLNDQKVGGDITLFGYSMGGAVATSFAAKHPDRLRQLVLIAPAGLGHDLGPIARLAVGNRWLGLWLMLGIYPASLRREIAAEQGLPGPIAEMAGRQIAETRRRGFAPAMLASLRGILGEDLETAHRSIARTGLPVLAIWGRDDTVIPIFCMGRLAEWNRNARHEVIEGAGHSLAYTDHDAVLQALSENRTH